MSRAVDRVESALDRLLEAASATALRRFAVIVAVALAVALPGIASLPVTDRDEARFAQATKQMLETGDLIDIRFQDSPRWKKPVGIYWLQAASARAFGGGAEAGIWAYRLPSALAVVAAALVAAWAARPLIGRRGALMSGVILATTLLMAVEAHIAKTDAALTLTAVAALGALAHLLHGSGGRGTALVFWLAIAAAILLKGPMVPVIVLATLGWLWIAHRRPPALARLHPLPGLALTAALVAPWLVAIADISDGAFFAEALGRDLGGKLVAGQEKHWGPPGLYLALVWVTFWPWAALLPQAAPWLWQHRRTAWAALLAGWVVPFWVLLEVVPTKLPHYVLPLYPALAIALAAWLAAPAGPAPRWARRTGAGLVAVPGLGLVALAWPLPLLLAERWMLLPDAAAAPDLLPSRATWEGAALGLAAVLAVGAAALAALRGRKLTQAAAGGVAAMLLYAAAFGHSLPALQTGFPSVRMAELLAQWRPCASGPPWSVGYHEPSLVFLAGTDIRLADPEGAVAALQGEPGALVLMEERWRTMLGGLPDAVVRDRITYFNYNRGSMATAELLTSRAPRWEACAG